MNEIQSIQAFRALAPVATPASRAAQASGPASAAAASSSPAARASVPDEATIVSLSPESFGLQRGEKAATKQQGGQTEGSNSLTPQEKQVVRELQARDREVRSHEAAHKAAGGRYTGAVHYSYATGPDNRQYAVGGEVSIDASPVPDNPEATIAKMEVVRRAALAPAQPSGADVAVASAASRTEQAAAMEMSRERIKEVTETHKTAESGVSERSEEIAPGI